MNHYSDKAYISGLEYELNRRDDLAVTPPPKPVPMEEAAMSQAKFTPGPWIIHELTTFEDRISPAADPTVCIARTGNWLFHEKGEQHANARLIAAAPCLLEALQAIVTELMDGDDLSATQIARHAGRAAIEKATGEAQ